MIVRAAALGLLVAVLMGGPARADGPQVVVAPSSMELTLGQSVDVTVVVVNTGTATTKASVVHVDITDPTSEASVDPEDWTPTLSQVVGELVPGESAEFVWTIQPISSGSFALYAVVLTPGSASAGVSNVVDVSVTAVRTLNPKGVLPVSLGMPSLVGALLIATWRRNRRRSG